MIDTVKKVKDVTVIFPVSLLEKFSCGTSGNGKKLINHRPQLVAERASSVTEWLMDEISWLGVSFGRTIPLEETKQRRKQDR